MTAPARVRSRANRFLRPVGLIVGFYVLTFVALGVLETLGLFLPGVGRLDPRDAGFQWVSLVSVVIATWIMLRVEKIPWSAVGLDRSAASPKLLLKGAALGGLTIGLASVALLGMHMLQIVPTLQGSWWGEAGRTTLLLLPAAFFEELFVRGYVFAVLRRAAGWKTALIVTSIVFGFLHAANPGVDAEAILAVIVAGFFLGAIFLFTRSLYAAGAAHFAWNWIMAGALHIAVSGMPSRDPDYKVVETGPDWLTGGPWGPEGGAAAVLAMFIVVFYLYGRHQRRGEWNWGPA
ncbi:MAG TPA: type II CAAX endopeptidase family protein [Gemmatimonadaceae bacterium]|nr:type II CAAX endopeptidase family protein [Gemmatimonadaceae bacterium]